MKIEKFIKIYNELVFIVSWIIHAALIILGLYLIFWQRNYIAGSLLCIVEGVWGIENQLAFPKKDNA